MSTSGTPNPRGGLRLESLRDIAPNAACSAMLAMDSPRIELEKNKSIPLDFYSDRKELMVFNKKA